MKPACPTCRSSLSDRGDHFACERGHVFPAHHGVAVLLDASEGWDASATAKDFENLYRAEAEPWNYTRNGAERMKYAFLVEQAARWCGRQGGAVADVGCSLGGAACELAAQGYGVLGLDLSPTAIVRARENASKRFGATAPTFVVASATRLPLADQSCDVVLLSDGLRSWRLSPDQVRQCLAETKRVLRPGGIAVIQDYMHPRHFDRFIASVRESELRLVEAHYLGDRLFYKLRGWAQKLHLGSALAGFFASETIAHGLRGLSRLVGRRGSKHICLIAQA